MNQFIHTGHLDIIIKVQYKSVPAGMIPHTTCMSKKNNKPGKAEDGEHGRQHRSSFFGCWLFCLQIFRVCMPSFFC